MLSQTYFLCKWFATLPAFIWLFPTVSTNMLDQLYFCYKPFITLATLEWLLSSMCPFMWHQALFPAQTFSTLVTSPGSCCPSGIVRYWMRMVCSFRVLLFFWLFFCSFACCTAIRKFLNACFHDITLLLFWSFASLLCFVCACGAKEMYKWCSLKANF